MSAWRKYQPSKGLLNERCYSFDSLLILPLSVANSDVQVCVGFAHPEPKQIKRFLSVWAMNKEGPRAPLATSLDLPMFGYCLSDERLFIAEIMVFQCFVLLVLIRQRPFSYLGSISTSRKQLKF